MTDASHSSVDATDSDGAVLELVNEFLERAQAGEQPSIEEYCETHPELAEEIRDVFPALVMLEDLQPQSGEAEESDQENLPDQIGDYRIIGQIGRGGMGIVYEAEQESLGRRVALKVLPTNQLNSRSAQIRFQREARAAAKMHHTNIVPVFEVGHDGDYFFYAMQLIAGQGLDQIIDELRLTAETEEVKLTSQSAVVAKPSGASSRSVSVTAISGSSRDSSSGLSTTSGGSSTSQRETYFQSAARLALQVADALAFAHSRSVIHRDIKPSNLLLDVHGVTWVTDFGLAKMLEDDQTLTKSGDYLGTLRYMSPERFRGQCDERSDVYSAGLTLYELISLRPAFEANDRIKLIYLINNTEPPRPRAVDPAIPRDLETIILKCIEKEPESRYSSAIALHEDLQRFLNDEPILARRLSGFEQASRWVRRNRGLAVSLMGIAALLLVLGVGGMLTAFHQSELRSNAETAQFAAELARDEANSARDFARDEQQKSETAEQQAQYALQRAEEAARKESEALDAVQLARSQLARNLYLSESREALYLRNLPGGNQRIRAVVERWANDETVNIERGWEWDLLTACAQPDGISIPAFQAKEVTWRPDNEQFAVAHGHVVNIHNAQTGKRVGEQLTSHKSTVTCVDWSPDGQKIASAGADNCIRIWDATTQNELLTIGPLDDRVAKLCWSNSGDRIAFGCDNVGIFLINMRESDLVPEKIFDLNTLCRHLEWSPDDTRLLDGVWFNHHMTLYNVEDRSVEKPLQNATGVIWKDGHEIDAILHTTGSGQIDLFDETGSSRRQLFLKHNSWPVDIDVHAESGIFVSVANDRQAIVWNLKTSQPRRRFVEHGDGLSGVWLSPDGRKVISAGRFSVRLWNVNDPIRMILDNKTDRRGIRQYRVTDLAWHPNGHKLATSAYDGVGKIWDLENLSANSVIGGIGSSVAFHPDGKTLASGVAGSGGVFYDLQDGLQAHQVEGAAIVRWSRSGGYLATIGAIQDLQTVQLFEYPSLKRIFHERGLASAVDLHPNDESLLFASLDRKVVRRNLAGEQEELFAFKNNPTEVRWSPDGRYIALATKDRIIHLWDAETRQQFVLKGHRDEVSQVSWHPDSKRLASSSDDGTVRIWDVASRTEVLNLSASYSGVRCVEFSPDGRSLAVGSENGEVVIWKSSPDRTDQASEETTRPDKKERPSPEEPPDTIYQHPIAARLLSDNFGWSEPQRLPETINSDFEEYEPFLSTDGLTLYFHSDRPGGFGRDDIWLSRRDSLDAEWQPAVNAGGNVNSEGDDQSPHLNHNGLMLHFNSDREQGNRDLWHCRRDSADAEWSTAERLSAPANTIHADIEPSLSSDEKTMVYVTTQRGRFDLWMTQRTSVESKWETPQRLLGNINSEDWQGSPTLTGDAFGSVLMFHSFAGAKVASRRSRDAAFQWAEFMDPNETLGVIYSPFLSRDGETLYFRKHDVLLGTFDLWEAHRVKKAHKD